MIMTRAPMRITLGGGGTDLPSYYERCGGFILSAAINKYIYIIVNRPSADKKIRVKYSQYEEVDAPQEVQHDLVRPALELLGIEDNIEIASMADVPAGTGLGSSSTYCVALLAALHALNRAYLSPTELAATANHIEMVMAGHPVGKQDHYLAALGGITSLEIDRDGTVEAKRQALAEELVPELNQAILLFFTGITRSANGILAQQNQDTDRGDPPVIASLDRTKEIGLQIQEALQDGDLDRFGQLLHEHWMVKVTRSGSISDPRVDGWYQKAIEAGALGGKLVGAGGGGFLMLYCPEGTRVAVRRAMAGEGLSEMPYRFDLQGAKTVVDLR